MQRDVTREKLISEKYNYDLSMKKNFKNTKTINVSTICVMKQKKTKKCIKKCDLYSTLIFDDIIECIIVNEQRLIL